MRGWEEGWGQESEGTRVRHFVDDRDLEGKWVRKSKGGIGGDR